VLEAKPGKDHAMDKVHENPRNGIWAKKEFAGATPGSSKPSARSIPRKQAQWSLNFAGTPQAIAQKPMNEH
jgi:hypothetical protein